MQSTAKQVKAAKHVVIVGGGPLGIEYAAEVVETFAGKSVTLVHSGARLLEAKKEKLGNFAKKWLEEHGVTVGVRRGKIPGNTGAMAWQVLR